jgi:hypothetical protein
LLSTLSAVPRIKLTLLQTLSPPVEAYSPAFYTLYSEFLVMLSSSIAAQSIPQAPALKAHDELAAKVESHLRATSYAQLRDVSCESELGVLTLRGRVSTFYMKQIAQTLVREVPGVSQVVNLIQVAR